MLRIALCEDEPIQLEVLRDLLEAYIYNKKISADIQTYTTAIDILSTNQTFDVYLLDIILPGDIDGIKLGRLIKSQNAAANIVYISSDSAYAIDAYKIRALNYILKPIKKEELFAVLDECYDKAYKNRFILKTPDGYRKKVITDLVYVNVGRRSLLYHFKDGSVLEGLNIRSNFEEEVKGLIADSNFCFLRPSLLVNLNEIELLDKNIITFKQGDQIKLSAPQLKVFKKAWTFDCLVI